MKRIEARWAWVDGVMVRDAAILIDGAGLVAFAGKSSECPGGDEEVQSFPAGLALPGGVNSHSHAWQVLLRGRLDSPAGFRDWVDRGLYPFLEDMDDEALETGALLAFSEMALSGVTTVGEFHYVHNPPISSPGNGWSAEERDAAVMRAARRVGLRIHLLRGLYDLGTRPGQRRFQETPEEAIDRLSRLDSILGDDSCASVGAAPHSLHGASGDMIRAAAEWSAERSRPMHIHIAEQKEDIDVAQEKYGLPPVAALESLGVVDERLVCVHGVWLTTPEIKTLGEAGAGLAYNPTSNMALGDGTTPLEAFAAAGIPVSLGTDGACANNQFDIFAEARRAEHMQRLLQLRMGVLPRALQGGTGEGSDAGALLSMVTENGGRNLGLPVGRITKGSPADVVVLDTTDLSLLPHDPDGDGEDLLSNVIYAMSIRSCLAASYVAGKQIVDRGRLVLLDQDDIAARTAAWSRRTGSANG